MLAPLYSKKPPLASVFIIEASSIRICRGELEYNYKKDDNWIP